jgi:phosphopentomutase
MNPDLEKRVVLVVLDSVGIGEAPDAAAFGDAGSDTLRHIAERVAGFKVPNLARLGLAGIEGLSYLPVSGSFNGAFGRAVEVAKGKDTTSGHWEIAGLHHDLIFPYFPEGFPAAFIAEFEKRIGRKIIGNKVASGTEIIDELGDEHVRTGSPIVYTSSDSVFQIAMHESVIPIEEQYRICSIAREMLTGDVAVGRVIARPFTGSSGAFKRTANRKDYSVLPPGDTLLDKVKASGLPVGAVGKIYDIFAGQGVTESLKTADNNEGIDKTIELMRRQKGGLIFTNLVDFDMLFGHRRDPQGYASCLMEFDARLPEILSALKPGDLFILTADHGNDPTFRGTDHTREYVPIVVAGSIVASGASLGTRSTFADIAATAAAHLGISSTLYGTSFYADITA